MAEERKHAILFAAALLCARKLMALDCGRPSQTKFAAVQNAISQAKFITGQDRRRVAEED